MLDAMMHNGTLQIYSSSFRADAQRATLAVRITAVDHLTSDHCFCNSMHSSPCFCNSMHSSPLRLQQLAQFATDIQQHAQFTAVSATSCTVHHALFLQQHAQFTTTSPTASTVHHRISNSMHSSPLHLQQYAQFTTTSPTACTDSTVHSQINFCRPWHAIADNGLLLLPWDQQHIAWTR